MKQPLSLGPKDKYPAPHGFGVYFEHTDPQRRMPCLLGDMLVPASADDIPPVSADAMHSVERALALLQTYLGDRDVHLFLGCGGTERERALNEAAAVGRVANALRGILRVAAEVK
jgi:hypothetical protein